MLRRLLIGAIFLIYLICVLILSGVQKEDLDVSLLKKLEHYNINIGSAINNVTALEECLGPEKVDSDSVSGAQVHTRENNTGIWHDTSTRIPVTLSQNNFDEKLTQNEIPDFMPEVQETQTVIEDATQMLQGKDDKSAQDILNLWETYATPSSEDNEDLSKLIDFGETTINNTSKTKNYSTGNIDLTMKNTYNSKAKYNQKEVDYYISKQFQKYLPNKPKNNNFKPRRKSIEFKLRKTKKQANIVFKSNGLEEFPFANIVELTNAEIKPPITTGVDDSHNLILSDYIINKIAKSVKTMVIDDLRKELPMHYQLLTTTTVKCCPTDFAGLMLSTTEFTNSKLTQLTTEMHTTTISSSTPTTVSETKTPDMTRSQPFKQEHLLALQKFLEIFGLQSIERSPTATTTEQNRMVYPYALPLQTTKHSQDLHGTQITHNELLGRFQPMNNAAQIDRNPQYNTNHLPNNKNKMVVTLQSNIGEIPPLRIPDQGARIFQNIIVSTKSPGGGHNEKQRWWKAKNLSQFKMQAARYEPTSPYESSIESEFFRSPAPIRMSKGKLWSPLFEQSDGYARRPRPWQNGYKIRYKNTKKAKFHEVLEQNPESTSGSIKPNENEESSPQERRPQHPINNKNTYNEAPFKKIMQTQQKVNDMLERILEMNNAGTKDDIGTAID